MDYQKIYNQIIKRGKFRISEERVYYEIHHILPKCMGGGEEKENKVKLEAREHFLCHWLLCRIYPENYKLIQAFWLMACIEREQYKYTISSRMYAEAKENYIKLTKGRLKPKGFGEKIHLAFQNKTQEERNLINLKRSLGKINRSIEAKQIESKKKIEIWENRTLEKKNKIKEKQKNIWKNKPKEKKEERNLKLSKSLSKPILQFDFNWNFIREWPSIKETNKKLHSNIGGYLKGTSKYAANSFWKYKKDLSLLELESLTSFYC